MFSPALEIVLTLAHREATSRRHAHLTLEHLLYALAHDTDGESILRACGADLPRLRQELHRYLQDEIEQFPRGREKDPSQTLAFRRALQTAVLHVQSAGRSEVRAGDVLAATLQESRSFAARTLAGQGVTRLDILNFISHGIRKVPAEPGEGPPEDGHDTGGGAPAGDDTASVARDPLSAYAVNLSERAASGLLDPLIGRQRELQRTLEVLCRRKKNGPVFVGDAGVGKTAMAEGLAQRLLQADVPEALEGAEVFALDSAALLAGTRFRGDFEERFKALLAALEAPRQPHSLRGRAAQHCRRRRDDGRDHGPRDDAEARAGIGRAPRRGLDHVRGVQADREGPGALTALPEGRPSRNPRPRRPSASCRACRSGTRSTIAWRTRRLPSKRRPDSPHVTSGTTGCRIRPSTCWTRPAPWSACRRRSPLVRSRQP